MTNVTLRPVTDFDRVGEIWSEFEKEAGQSVFQSWAWTGCMADQRFPKPVLLEARRGSALVALGLFNLRCDAYRTALWLGQSGDRTLDAPFIEHNGLLVLPGEDPSLLGSCLRVAQTGPIGTIAKRARRSLILSGVGNCYVAAARSAPGILRVHSAQIAPFIDLHAFRQSGTEYLFSLSSNTRYQLLRSQRRYEEAFGKLTVHRARSPQEGIEFLDKLAYLHQAYWNRRGMLGAFSSHRDRAFHTTLLKRAFNLGAIDILKITAGAHVLGYLYNLKAKGRICAYQSGFDYSLPHRHCKPGLTSHYLAIKMYTSEGAHTYDFLAGGDRYKITMANGMNTLYWIALHPLWSIPGLVASARGWYAQTRSYNPGVGTTPPNGTSKNDAG